MLFLTGEGGPVQYVVSDWGRRSCTVWSVYVGKGALYSMVCLCGEGSPVQYGLSDWERGPCTLVSV